VQFNSSTTVNHLQIRVSNITGQQVWSGEYKNTTGAFSADMDLTGKAAGLYIVEINADGERMVRKLTLQ